jgi:hypothetical protein
MEYGVLADLREWVQERFGDLSVDDLSAWISRRFFGTPVGPQLSVRSSDSREVDYFPVSGSVGMVAGRVPVSGSVGMPSIVGVQIT